MAISRIEWGAFALALIIAHAFYARGVIFPSAFDAEHYRVVARDIGNVGLFAKFESAHIRSYGYPLFLLALDGLAALLRLPWGLVVFEVQLALYLLAALVMRSNIAPASPRVARVVLVALVLNPFALLYASETLTESLSITLIVCAAACWIRMLVAPPPSWMALALGSLAIGLAIVVRPANVYALPAWVVGAFAIAWVHCRSLRQGAVGGIVVLALIALPLIPQVANNVRHFNSWTPLVAYSLGKLQHYMGVRYLKYATGLPPVAEGGVHYENPFVLARPVDRWHPRDWYFEHPIAGMTTIGLHIFGMLDQDLLFTYARDLDPWYRRPLGVLTHGVVALAALGLGTLLWRSGRDQSTRAIALTLAALVGTHVALHATTAVEMRFGLPLLVLAGPLACWFAITVWPRATFRWRAMLAAYVFAWVGASLILSDWIRAQAPQIVAWEADVRYVPKSQ